MTRQTSIEAYRQIKEDGLLSERRFEAYELLFHHGPCTAKEMMQFAKNEGTITNHIHLYSLEKRLSELRKMGCVAEAGERSCNVSGMTAILWEVTGKLPKDFDKTKQLTRNELINALCEQLETAAEVIQTRVKLTDKGRAWMERTRNLMVLCSKYRKKRNIQ